MDFQTLSMTFLAAATQTPGAEEPGLGSILTMILPLALMGVIFYFMLIRPERKRAKKMKSMLDNLQVADEVVTAGGIIGRVVSVKEDTVLIETGSDRTKLRILRSSIAENRTIHDEPEAVTITKTKKA